MSTVIPFRTDCLLSHVKPSYYYLPLLWLSLCKIIIRKKSPAVTCLCISSTCLCGMLLRMVYISDSFSSGITTDALFGKRKKKNFKILLHLKKKTWTWTVYWLIQTFSSQVLQKTAECRSQQGWRGHNQLAARHWGRPGPDEPPAAPHRMMIPGCPQWECYRVWQCNRVIRNDKVIQGLNKLS